MYNDINLKKNLINYSKQTLAIVLNVVCPEILLLLTNKIFWTQCEYSLIRNSVCKTYNVNSFIKKNRISNKNFKITLGVIHTFFAEQVTFTSIYKNLYNSLVCLKLLSHGELF